MSDRWFLPQGRYFPKRYFPLQGQRSGRLRRRLSPEPGLHLRLNRPRWFQKQFPDRRKCCCQKQKRLQTVSPSRNLKAPETVFPY